MPEVIFAQGKTPRQVAEIFRRLAEHGGNVLATRATEEQYAAVAAAMLTSTNIVPWREPSSSSAIASATAKA